MLQVFLILLFLVQLVQRTQSGQMALIDGSSSNQYAQLYCRSNIFGVQGNIIATSIIAQ